MNVTIFGATGRTGRHLVEQALEQGYNVTAFVRDPSKMETQHERLSLVQGDVHNPERVAAAVAGADAVLLALGHTDTSTKDVLTAGTRNVLDAMQEHDVDRLVSLTGAGVSDPKDEPGLFNKVMTFLLKRMQADLLADSERQADLIRSSDLDWTIVRVPMLTDGPHTGNIRAGYVGKGTGPRISRADTADFILQQLEDDTYVRDAPMISG